MKDIVIVISLIHFGTFASLVCLVSVKYDTGRSGCFRCLCIQFADCDYTFQSGTTSCVCMYHIYFSVLIPKRASVDNPFSRLYKNRLTPRTFRIFCFHHESPLVRVSPKDIKFTVVVTNGRSPYTVTVFRSFRSFNRSKGIGDGSADNCPVHQILGMQNLQSGQAVETG